MIYDDETFEMLFFHDNLFGALFLVICVDISALEM